MSDGVHILSNSKDQTAKLWDVRRASSLPRGHPCSSVTEWDYRGAGYPYAARRLWSPYDASVMTYSR
jgi:WD repeat-containing protein 23